MKDNEGSSHQIRIRIINNKDKEIYLIFSCETVLMFIRLHSNSLKLFFLYIFLK